MPFRYCSELEDRLAGLSAMLLIRAFITAFCPPPTPNQVSFSLPLDATSNGIEIGKVEAGRWQFLAVSHSSKGKSCRLTVFLGSEGRRYIVDYPKFPKKSRYLEQTFFLNLSCSSSSVLISEAPMNPEKIEEVSKKLPYGICKLKDMATLAELHIGKVMSAWTPLRTLQRSVYSVLKHSQKIRAVLNGNSGVHAMNKRLTYLDRMSNLVPLFHIVSLVDADSGRKLLGSILQVCHVYLEKSFASSVPEIRFAREVKCFARSFGINLLHYDPSLMNGDLIKQIGGIACICPKLKRKVLKMFMATINYWVNIQCDIFFWEVIKACIISNIHSYSDIINTNILIDIMESINNSSCCSTHCIEDNSKNCLLYTSDAADDMQCVDLGGRRIIKKKKKK
eukprot:TRINITY_DN11346_c0_g7_i1.p1 TRINITY_DN11346_c0_g7~~TRINITY_DN11346_c0_g7_i1.p1  ORF type:complete len:393 (-),score=87.89 TRINITY_DN11346_c0_g7_i1:26-1204(-)